MITGIILASGFSRRMGRDKLLIDIDGEKIIERVIEACCKSKLDDIILIYRSEEIKEIAIKYNIKTIYNENAHLGQSEGLKLGVKAAIHAESYMFLVGDQPFLTSEIINKLIGEYNQRDSSIILPYYNGHRGMPMIISSLYKEELLDIVGDKGGRDIIRNNPSEVKKVYIEGKNLGIDIDTLDDLKKLLENK